MGDDLMINLALILGGDMLKYLVGIIGTLLLFTHSALAEFYEPPYTQIVITLDQQLNEISIARGLSDSQAYQAKKAASAWAAAGPCELPNIENAEAAVAIIMNPNPKIPLNAAILEMTAILAAKNLGRKPPEAVCRYASDMAAS